MNPLLFANLANQKRLLESGSAYQTARLAINVAFSLAGVGGLLGAFMCIRTGMPPFWWGGVPLANDILFAYRASLVVFVLVYVAGLYVSWAAIGAYFDIADACLAMSLLGGAEEPGLPEESSRGPRAGGGSWPEPPKPLMPAREAPRKEDAKYMPKE